MTDYINGVPVLSPSSFSRQRACFQCGADLSKSLMIYTIEEGKEPFRETEVCISCRNGSNTKTEKDDE